MKLTIPTSCLIAVVAVALNFQASASGQEIVFPKRPNATTVLEKMRGGTEAVNANPRNEESLKELAMWLAHRLVHPPYNGKEIDKKVGGFPDDIETLMEEVNKWCGWPNPKATPNEIQLAYAKAFGKALTYEIMDVYQKTDKKLERINAIRMLSMVGKLPYADLADTYLKIIRDNAYPMEIKLFAFEGLRNLLAIPDVVTIPNTPVKHFITNNAKLAEISQELEKFITFKCAPGTTPEDARVIQYIRREAVKALAHMKFAVIRQQQQPLAKPIMTLLRVATNDKYVKPGDEALPGYGFSLLERIEAVIGICSMIPDKDVNVDLVTYLVNDAMIDIAAAQAKDRGEFQKDARNRPLVPWKITGVRMADAFNTWKKNLTPPMTSVPPGGRNPSFAVAWTEPAIKIVAKWEAEGTLAQPDYRPFDDWKKDPTRKPKATQVIVDDETTAITVK